MSAATKPRLFRRPEEIFVLSDAAAVVVGCLSTGRIGPQTVTVSASKRGYKIKIGRFVLVEAKMPEELAAKFKAMQAEAKKK